MLSSRQRHQQEDQHQHKHQPQVSHQVSHQDQLYTGPATQSSIASHAPLPPSPISGPRPEFLRRNRKKHRPWSRKYRAYEYNKYDDDLDTVSIGGGLIQKEIKVDVSFLFSKSKWGVLGHRRQVAGIVYLDLNFHQPPKHHIEEVTILVTVDDQDPSLPLSYPVYTGDVDDRETCPVHVTNWYGPKQMVSQEAGSTTTTRADLRPWAGVFGTEFGLGGVSREREVKRTSRWSCSGQRFPNPDVFYNTKPKDASQNPDWRYRTLCWQLTGNELDAVQRPGNTIHTAFSFEHSAQPFYLHVEVQGTLSDSISQFKQQFGRGRKKENMATTLVKFGRSQDYKMPLDELARGLPLAMELENMLDVPVEIPTTMPASYSKVHDSLSTSASGTTLLRSTTPDPCLIPTSASPATSPVVVVQDNSALPAATLDDDPTEPSDGNLIRHALSPTPASAPMEVQGSEILHHQPLTGQNDIPGPTRDIKPREKTWYITMIAVVLQWLSLRMAAMVTILLATPQDASLMAGSELLRPQVKVHPPPSAPNKHPQKSDTHSSDTRRKALPDIIRPPLNQDYRWEAQLRKDQQRVALAAMRGGGEILARPMDSDRRNTEG